MPGSVIKLLRDTKQYVSNDLTGVPEMVKLQTITAIGGTFYGCRCSLLELRRPPLHRRISVRHTEPGIRDLAQEIVGSVT